MARFQGTAPQRAGAWGIGLLAGTMAGFAVGGVDIVTFILARAALTALIIPVVIVASAAAGVVAGKSSRRVGSGAIAGATTGTVASMTDILAVVVYLIWLGMQPVHPPRQPPSGEGGLGNLAVYMIAFIILAIEFVFVVIFRILGGAAFGAGGAVLGRWLGERQDIMGMPVGATEQWMAPPAAAPPYGWQAGTSYEHMLPTPGDDAPGGYAPHAAPQPAPLEHAPAWEMPPMRPAQPAQPMPPSQTAEEPWWRRLRMIWIGLSAGIVLTALDAVGGQHSTNSGQYSLQTAQADLIPALLIWCATSAIVLFAGALIAGLQGQRNRAPATAGMIGALAAAAIGTSIDTLAEFAIALFAPPAGLQSTLSQATLPAQVIGLMISVVFIWVPLVTVRLLLALPLGALGGLAGGLAQRIFSRQAPL